MMEAEPAADDHGMRLDAFVASKFDTINRTLAGKLCSSNKVTVNGTVQKSSYKIKPKDAVCVNFEMSEEYADQEHDIKILYQDNEVIVVDKPVGMLSHSKGAYNAEQTVASFIKDYLEGFEGSERDGIVHRLDRTTSGVMICAKTPDAQKWLQKQFSTRKVSKKYVAIVGAPLDPDEALIDMPIGRNPKKPTTFCVTKSGKEAQTHYRVQASNEKYVRVLLEPKTGRTHQLRVHLAHLKHPIVGDVLYGGEEHDRVMLHAQQLELMLPDKSKKTFSSKLPAEFDTIVE